MHIKKVLFICCLIFISSCSKLEKVNHIDILVEEDQQNATSQQSFIEADQRQENTINNLTFTQTKDNIVTVTLESKYQIFWDTLPSQSGQYRLLLKNLSRPSKLKQIYRFNFKHPVKSAVLMNHEDGLELRLLTLKPLAIKSNESDSILVLHLYDANDPELHRPALTDDIDIDELIGEQDDILIKSLIEDEIDIVEDAPSATETFSPGDVSAPARVGQMILPGMRTYYEGEPISVDFQDSSIEQAVRLLNEVCDDFNLIMRPDVGGRISLKLENMPCSLILEHILLHANLGVEEFSGTQKWGRVLRILPANEIISIRQQRQQLYDSELNERIAEIKYKTEIDSLQKEALRKELEYSKIIESLEEPKAHVVLIKYAKAEDIARQIGSIFNINVHLSSSSDSTQNSSNQAGSRANRDNWGSSFDHYLDRKYSVLEAASGADRYQDTTHFANTSGKEGGISVSTLKNSITIRETPPQIKRIVELIEQLDQPEPQVLIEARVVYATDEFQRALGLKWGGGIEGITTEYYRGMYGAAGGGTPINQGGVGTTGYLLNTPIAMTPTFGIGGFISKLVGPDMFTLDAQLQLGEIKGESRTVSSPRILTINNHKATIEQGTRVRVNVFDEAGNPQPSFEPAVLKLDVTPQVIPGDDKITLDLEVKDDAPSVDGQNIDTKTAKTRLVVDIGETIVLGGVLKSSARITEDRVPGIADMPGLGWLFKSRSNTTKSEELLIFIRASIID
jgi:type IV pilus secretin PilQ/predicted competence protein